MINKERLLTLFADLAETDNPSRQEREICEKLKEKLKALDIPYEEDDAGAKIGGNCGNLYAYVEGDLDLPPILLSAHMDNVDPACGKKAVFHPGGRITSDGSTVLGADDLSGIAIILEALTVLKELQIPHRPIELVFDVAEEAYCIGIQHFDFSRLRAKEVYVFDIDGPVGYAASQAPTMISFQAEFQGRGAHAAFAPEDGIHAIKAAARAITDIECGRVGDTTVNIGIINGGIAGNIVPEHCSLTGEVRSFSEESAHRKLQEIEAKMRKAAEEAGAGLTFTIDILCGAYQVDHTEPVVRRFQNACAKLGLSGGLVSTYGGSVNNHFYHQGIHGLVVAPGMNCCHSKEEYTTAEELERAADLVLELILAKE